MAATQAKTQPKRSFNEILSDQKTRGIIYQVVVLLLIFWAISAIAGNTIANLQKLGVVIGLEFLDQVSGISVIQTVIEFDRTGSYGRLFIVSLLNTLILSFCGIIFATFLGFLIGIMRLSPNVLMRTISGIYVEIFRNVPLLLQIIFWYTAVLKPLPSPRDIFVDGQELFVALTNRGLLIADIIPEAGFGATVFFFLFGIVASIVLYKWANARKLNTGRDFPLLWSVLGLIIVLPLFIFLVSGAPIHFEPAVMGRFKPNGGIVLIPEFIALFLALVAYTAAFIAEIVRAGIQAVAKGQFEAASALGMKRRYILSKIVIPQAMRVIIPPLTSQYLNLTKNSSLAAAIGYPELVSVFAGTVLNQTGRAVEIMSITLAVYLVISLFTSFVLNQYNRRIQFVER